MSAAPIQCDVRFSAQADLLLLIANLLSSPAQMLAADLNVPTAHARQLVEMTGAEHHEALADALTATLDAARTTDQAPWCAEYTRLFHGPVACAVNETAYVRRDKGVILADICGFYEAFGFATQDASGEKADHIACELEFLAMLLIMLARAHATNAEEKARITESAFGDFLTDHLADWVVQFSIQLESQTTLDFYRSVACLLRLAVTSLALDHGVIVPSDPLAMNIDDTGEVGTPYECGMVENKQFVSLTGPGGPIGPTEANR